MPQNRTILCGCGGDFYRPPQKSRLFEAPRILDAQFPLRRKSLANRDFFCEENGQKMALTQGNPNGGLANGGLARKAPIGPKRALSGQFLLFPRGCGCGGIGPEKAPIGPEKAPICPEKARFPRKDFPLIFSENLGLKPPFVSPRLDFPNSLLRIPCDRPVCDKNR